MIKHQGKATKRRSQYKQKKQDGKWKFENRFQYKPTMNFRLV